MKPTTSGGNRTNHPKKRFCVHAHDTQLVGRNKYGDCNECMRFRGRAENRSNPGAYRKYKAEYQWKRYGITNKDGSPFTQVDYDRQYQIQQGKCLSCGIHQSELKTGLHSDHDHQTGTFRFLLCNNCNRTLGHAQDNPVILRKLADLLEGK
jgi:hypothetical protein